MELRPSDLEDIGNVMSNYDHQIEEDAEKKLKSGPFYGGYAALNFHGTVWYADERFKCRIMQYGMHVDTIVADSLSEIMETASTEYGMQ